MNIIISNATKKSIYEQIYNQIKALIISGDLKEGDILPSIRNLAKDLRISVITTKRAYDELEKDGYIYSVAGKGSYVAGVNNQLLQETQLKEIEEHIKEILKLANNCKLKNDDIIEMFNIISKEI